MSLATDAAEYPQMSGLSAAIQAQIVRDAQRMVTAYLGLPRFPILAQGYSVSGASPSTDLSALSTNAFNLSVDGGVNYEVTPTLASCTSGAATAAELQSTIRAISDTYELFEDVTVTYTNSLYTITSPTYGSDSSIALSYDSGYKHVLQALKLTPEWGGKDYPGADEDEEVYAATLRQILVWANQAKGLEGLSGGTIPGGLSFTVADMDPDVRRVLQARRLL